MNSRSDGDISGASLPSGSKPGTPSHPALARPKCASSASRSGKPRRNAAAAAADKPGAAPSSPAPRMRTTLTALMKMSYMRASRWRCMAPPLLSTCAVSTTPSAVTTSPGSHASHSDPVSSSSAKRGARASSSPASSSAASS